MLISSRTRTSPVLSLGVVGQCADALRCFAYSPEPPAANAYNPRLHRPAVSQNLSIPHYLFLYPRLPSLLGYLGLGVVFSPPRSTRCPMTNIATISVSLGRPTGMRICHRKDLVLLDRCPRAQGWSSQCTSPFAIHARASRCCPSTATAPAPSSPSHEPEPWAVSRTCLSMNNLGISRQRWCPP